MTLILTITVAPTTHGINLIKDGIKTMAIETIPIKTQTIIRRLIEAARHRRRHAGEI